MATNWMKLAHHGSAQSFYAEEDGKSYLIDHQTAAETQAILDENARKRSVQPKFNEKLPQRAGNGRLAAEIPTTIYMQWERDWLKNKKDDMTWTEYLIGKINSREWSQLKTIDEKQIFVPEVQRSSNA